jgi:hypothetical protein
VSVVCGTAMSPARRHYVDDAPHLSRPGAGKVFRGSRKRLRRMKWYEHTSVEFWIFVVLTLLMLFGGIPWMIRHPPRQAHQANEAR